MDLVTLTFLNALYSHFKNVGLGWVHWCIPVTLDLGWLRKGDFEFRVNPSDIVSSGQQYNHIVLPNLRITRPKFKKLRLKDSRSVSFSSF